MTTVTRRDFEGTGIAAAHVGDDTLDALVKLINDAAGGESLEQLRADLDPIIAGLGDGYIHIKSLPMVAGNNTPVDTTFDLPAHAKLIDVLVAVDTAEVTGATKTVDIGLLAGESGGDTDGFVDGVSVAAVGLFRAGVTVAAGVFSANTRGVLMSDFVAGTNADDRGLFNEKPHMSDVVTAKSVVYARGSTLTEFVGRIILVYEAHPAS